VNSSEGSERRFSAPRRQALRVLGWAAGGALAAETLSLLGCTGVGSTEGSGPVVLDLSELPVGRRVTVLYRRLPVEVRRTDNGIHARSLTCTHMGCTVRWDEGQRLYLCPCHKGIYDADGEVVSGPPPAPLPAVPVSVSDTTVTVGS
jgi:cytochrome b6-f complex iron-sulfur subunit